MIHSLIHLLQGAKQSLFGGAKKSVEQTTGTIQLPVGTEEFAQSLEQCVDKLHTLLLHASKKQSSKH